MLELLRMTLKKLLSLLHDKFKLKTVLTLAAQLISCIEYIHSKSLIHDDIRSENIMMSFKCRSSVYVIDFDFAQKYNSTFIHVDQNSISIYVDQNSTDTACFISINTY